MTNRRMTRAEELSIAAEMTAHAAALGIAVEVDPELAEHMGAFEESALDARDAEISRLDGEHVEGESR